MGCTKQFDFTTVTGAHLSFYWTMDEGGVADKIDSTQGLAWPIRDNGVAATGLFSNGIRCPPNPTLTHNSGLRILSSNSIAINQAVSTGIGVWFWIKILGFGGSTLEYFFDTSDPLHTNLFRLLLSSPDATHTLLELQHDNDTDSNFIDTPNIAWALNSWHMVGLTYDKTAKTLNIYVDGVLAATGPDLSVYPDLTTADMQLFNLAGVLDTLDFTCDELGMCLNAPLTQDQITALYNNGSGVTWPTVTTIVPFP